MQPTVGRTVHYVHTSGEILAAIIIKVLEDDHVALQIFRVDDNYQNKDVPYHAGKVDDKTYATGDWPAGTWHWPPRV